VLLPLAGKPTNTIAIGAGGLVIMYSFICESHTIINGNWSQLHNKLLLDHCFINCHNMNTPIFTDDLKWVFRGF
jgi:hypothetical protein